MRFIGALLVLIGILLGYEMVYKGKSIQQMGSDVGRFFHVPGRAGSASQGWTGQPSNLAGTPTFTGSTSGDVVNLSGRAGGNLAVGGP